MSDKKGRHKDLKGKWFNANGSDLFPSKDVDIEFGASWLVHWDEKKLEENYSNIFAIDYNEDLDMRLSAEDNIRSRIVEIVQTLLESCATKVQMDAYEGIFVECKPMEQVAHEAGKRYFAVNAALNGQRCNNEGNLKGRWYGGLFNKMRKQLSKCEEYLILREQLQLVYDDHEPTILKWSKV